jgi:betaine-aldehyde dehydrogenase
MRTYKHWIGGAPAEPSSALTTERRSPYNGEALATFALGGPEDVDAAVKAARHAFDHGPWRSVAGGERAEILNRLANLIQANADDLAAIEADESGKPIGAARGEIDFGTELLRYAASLAWNIPGRAMTHNGPGKLGLVLHEPRGVVGLVTPWNYPVVCLLMKLPFVLAAGCAVVIKPSEFTSGTTLEIASLAAQAGVPPGILNVVTGTGAGVGEALTMHRGIDMISFTGSTAVGKRILQNAADTIKRVSLELGGKGANIVFADADLEAAVEGALQGFIINQGEECCAGGRLLVESSIADEFLSRLVERSKTVRLGDPRDPLTEMGPLIHEAHVERVLGYIEKGKQEGATLMAGGERLKEGAFGKGCFVPPTIFTNIKPEMTIFREEIFGPVVAVTTFGAVDEAIEIANSTNYGLANGIWTSNLDKAMTMIQQLRSGMVYVNCYLQTIAQLPFGGMNESGLGREQGIEGLLEFMEVKSAFIKLKTV